MIHAGPSKDLIHFTYLDVSSVSAFPTAWTPVRLPCIIAEDATPLLDLSKTDHKEAFSMVLTLYS